MMLLMTFLITIPLSKQIASAAEVGEIIVAIETAQEVIEFLNEIGLTDIDLADPSTWAISKSWAYIKQFLEAQGNTPEDWVNAIATKIVKKGDNYYIADTNTQLVSPAQLAFRASDMPVGWSMPSNFYGAVISDAQFTYAGRPNYYEMYTNVTRFITSNEIYWLTPFVQTVSSGLLVSSTSFTIPQAAGVQQYVVNYRTHPETVTTNSNYRGFNGLGSNASGGIQPFFMAWNDGLFKRATLSSGIMTEIVSLSNNANDYSMNLAYNFYGVSGDRIYWNPGSISNNRLDYMSENREDYTNAQTIMRRGYLISSTVPSFDLDFDPSQVGEDVIVSPGGSIYNPGSADGYPYIPPGSWQTYATPAQYQSNSGMTFNQYVKDGYIINNNGGGTSGGGNFILDGSVDINANVTLGGGINIDITVNDKTELPSISGGDGENFFSANVIDVFAGLTKNNPILGTIIALFGAIDPAIVAIFSVTISLSFLLALWKLIRG